MRILIGGDTFAPDINGSATFMKRLSVALTQRGHEVHIVAPSGTGPASTGLEEHDGVPIMVHRLAELALVPASVAPLRPALAREANGRKLVASVKPDVVHFQSHIIVGGGLAPR